MQRWLLTTTTEKFASFKCRIPSGTPGRNSKSSQRTMYWPSGAFRLTTPSRSKNTARCMKQLLFDDLTNDVTDQHMAFLNARGHFRRHTNAIVEISTELQFPARLARKSDRVQLQFLGGRNRP